MSKKSSPSDSKITDLGNDRELHDVLSAAIDMKPLPNNLKSPYPVILAPGFLEDSLEVLPAKSRLPEDGIKTLVALGHRAISLQHPRKGEVTVSPEKFNLNKFIENIPPEAFQRPINLLRLIESKGLDKVDIVAHSQGGVGALIAASIDSTKFRHIVLSNPAGMLDEDSMLELGARFVRQLPKNSMQQQIDGVISALKNPLRVLRDAQGVAQSDIMDLIYSAHQSGITLSLVLDRNDPLFPAQSILDRVASQHYQFELKSGNKIDLPFTEIHIMDGHHNSLHEDPEGYYSVYSQQIINSMTDID